MSTTDLTAELVTRSATIRTLLLELAAAIHANTPEGYEPDPFTGWLETAPLMVSEVEAHVKRHGLYVPIRQDDSEPAEQLIPA